MIKKLIFNKIFKCNFKKEKLKIIYFKMNSKVYMKFKRK